LLGVLIHNDAALAFASRAPIPTAELAESVVMNLGNTERFRML
jgi:hypothetical protein